MEISKTTQKWLSISRNDLSDAKALLQFNEQFIRLISFAAQQSAEKAIKAYLVHVKLRFPNTHNIDELLKIMKQQNPNLATELDATAILSDYAIAYRYPDAAKEELDLATAKKLVEIAHNTLDIILKNLNK